MSETPRKRVRLLKFVPLRKNALRGFCDIELPNGMRIFGCPVLASRGRVWATLPGRPQLDRAGHQVQIDGKGQFAKIMEWNSRGLSDAFSEALVALVREQYPDALTDQEEAAAPVS
jgi:hypothetical protein